jgi:hypothetical protein
MNENKTFADGYADGWRAERGSGAPIPSIPSFSVPAGKTPYHHGLSEGTKAAQRANELEKKSK